MAVCQDLRRSAMSRFSWKGSHRESFATTRGGGRKKPVAIATALFGSILLLGGTVGIAAAGATGTTPSPTVPTASKVVTAPKAPTVTPVAPIQKKVTRTVPKTVPLPAPVVNHGPVVFAPAKQQEQAPIVTLPVNPTTTVGTCEFRLTANAVANHDTWEAGLWVTGPQYGGQTDRYYGDPTIAPGKVTVFAPFSFTGTVTAHYQLYDRTTGVDQPIVNTQLSCTTTPPPPPCVQNATATYDGSVLHVNGTLCSAGNGTTYTPDNQSKCDGTFANCVPQSEFANVAVPAGTYNSTNGNFPLASPSCGWYQWDLYTGAEQKTVGTTGTSNYVSGKLVDKGKCSPPPPPPAQPAQPTLDIRGCGCVAQGQNSSVEYVTVTNTADKTGAAVSYTYVVKDSSGSTVARGDFGSPVSDGKSATTEVDRLRVGNYGVDVTGSDKTSVSAAFSVAACPVSPAVTPPVVVPPNKPVTVVIAVPVQTVPVQAVPVQATPVQVAPGSNYPVQSPTGGHGVPVFGRPLFMGSLAAVLMGLALLVLGGPRAYATLRRR